MAWGSGLKVGFDNFLLLMLLMANADGLWLADAKWRAPSPPMLPGLPGRDRGSMCAGELGPGPPQAGTLCVFGEGLCSALTVAQAVNWGSPRARPRPGEGLSQATMEAILDAWAEEAAMWEPQRSRDTGLGLTCLRWRTCCS